MTAVSATPTALFAFASYPTAHPPLYPMMVGVDVSKDKLSCALVLRATQETQWRMDVANTVAGIDRLIARLTGDITRLSGGAAMPLAMTVALVVEPTGRYSDLIVRQANEKGIPVLLAPPARAKAFMNSLQSRAKTDPLDGVGLAYFGLSRMLRPFEVKSQTVEQIEQLLSARKSLSSSVAGFEMQRRELKYAAASLEPAIAALKAQIKSIDKQIAEMMVGTKTTPAAPELAAARALDAVPGIGPVIAAAVAAKLSSKSFTSPEAFVAYIGLDIAVRQSGKRLGQNGLTKQGDAGLRRLLYLGAQANLKCKDPDNPFKLLYKREREKGLKSTGALCAVARKLAKLCWSIHRYNTAYDPARVLTQPKLEKKQTIAADMFTDQDVQKGTVH